MSETELIELLKRKDRTAFKEIVYTWQDMAYNTVLGILQNAEDAEDVTQEVFIKVFRRLFKTIPVFLVIISQVSILINY